MCGRDEVVREANEADSGTREPYTPHQPKIWDRCPACGSRSLFIGAGGWLTCSVIGCKSPATGEVIEGLRAQVVEFKRELALREEKIQIVDGVIRPCPWSGSVHEAALVLALERLRRAGLDVMAGINSRSDIWWPHSAQQVGHLSEQLQVAEKVLRSATRPLGEAPHA